jgi:hypothetical protein
MSDDTKGTPAPAVIANVPAVDAPGAYKDVDLSDLQAELDAMAAKTEEDDVFADINDEGTKDAKSEKGEGDADEGDDKDAADEGEDEKTEGEGEEGDKPKKRSRADRYRDRITRLEQENAQLRSHSGGSLSKAQIAEHVEADIGPEPKEKDFDDYLTYEREHTAWILDKRQATREFERHLKTAQEERGRRISENVEIHKERVEAFRTRNGETSAKDFDAVMAKAKDLVVAPHLEEMILDSGKSAHLQYFFARNPARLDKINRMSEREAAREVGHIEARLSLPQPKTRTAAPEPTRTPRGGAAPASQEAELNSWLTKKYGSQ